MNTNQHTAPRVGSSVTFTDYRGTLRAGTVVSMETHTMAVVLDLASGDKFGVDTIEDPYTVVTY